MEEIGPFANTGGMQLRAQDIHNGVLAVPMSVTAQPRHGISCTLLLVFLKLGTVREGDRERKARLG